MSIETLIIRGRRVMVIRPRPIAATARAMAGGGLSAGRICAALGVSRERVAQALDAPADGIWGALAGALADEMRRAG